jgi:hypothetical protein
VDDDADYADLVTLFMRDTEKKSGEAPSVKDLRNIVAPIPIADPFAWSLMSYGY